MRRNPQGWLKWVEYAGKGFRGSWRLDEFWSWGVKILQGKGSCMGLPLTDKAGPTLCPRGGRRVWEEHKRSCPSRMARAAAWRWESWKPEIGHHWSPNLGIRVTQAQWFSCPLAPRWCSKFFLSEGFFLLAFGGDCATQWGLGSQNSWKWQLCFWRFSHCSLSGLWFQKWALLQSGIVRGLYLEGRTLETCF